MPTDTFTTTSWNHWVCPSNVSTATFRGIGAGGAGGKATGNPAMGGGGAGGSFAEASASVTPGRIYPISVAETTPSNTGTTVISGGATTLYRQTNELMSDNLSSVETSLEWNGISGVTVTQDNTRAYFGTWAVKAVSDGTAGGRWYSNQITSGVSAGNTYMASAMIWYQFSNNAAVQIDWLTSTGTYISTTLGVDQVVNANQWNAISVLGTAPANAARVVVIIQPNSVFNGATFWSDNHHFGLYETVVNAVGGPGGAAATTGGSGGTRGIGTTTGCIGTTTRKGGDGVNGVPSTVLGGAGGGGAGKTAVGGNGASGTGGTGNSPGGNGANAAALGTAGSTGAVYGGGGSGGNANNNTDRNGGGGNQGWAEIEYTVATSIPNKIYSNTGQAINRAAFF